MRFAILAAVAALGMSAPASAAAFWTFEISGQVTGVSNFSNQSTCGIPNTPGCGPAFGTVPENFFFRQQIGVLEFEGDRAFNFSQIGSNSSFPHDHFSFGYSGVLTFQNGSTFGTNLMANASGGPPRTNCGSPFQPPCYTTYVSAPTFAVNFVSSQGGPGPVPEPATWAMVIGGFGMVGGSMRYRRKALAALG